MVKVDGCVCEKCGTIYNPGLHPECPECARFQQRMDAIIRPKQKKRVAECGLYVEVSSSPSPPHQAQPSSRHQPQSSAASSGNQPERSSWQQPQTSSASSHHQPKRLRPKCKYLSQPSHQYKPMPSTAAPAANDSSASTEGLSKPKPSTTADAAHDSWAPNRSVYDDLPPPPPGGLSKQLLQRLYETLKNKEPVPKSSVSTPATPNASNGALPSRTHLTKRCQTPNCKRRVSCQPDRNGWVHNHCCSRCLPSETTRHSPKCYKRVKHLI